VSLEGLRTYRAISRRYRNRRVGDFLNELHLTEVRNTGMAKILRTMRQNGSPDPVFETDEDRLYFLTTLPVHPGFLPAGAAEKTPDVEKTTPEKPAAADRAEDLVAYLAHNPSATSAQIARELGVSSSTVGRLLADLKLEGRVRREGASRNGRWVVEG
jgi:ATP-dependent DNA helicase RecG